MKEPRNQATQKIIKTFAIIAVLFAVISITAAPALGNDNNDDEVNFIIPEHGYTVDYYRSYGEPIIQASIVGDPEFKRGEIAGLQVKIVNKGYIEGFKRLNGDQGGDNSTEELLALAELEEEEECTTTKDLKATLVSETEYIEVDPVTSVQDVEEIETGHTQTLRFTIKIDGDTPAGNYELLLPVSYEYQANVRTVTPEVINLGLTNTEFTREYKTKNTVLSLPVSIESEPKFEVTEVSGNLKQGETQVVEVSYTNTREITAEDAMARIIVMSPLSTEKSIVRLGDIGPGESKTALFEISADQDAVVKKYGIDSEIKYIDEEGETSFSENLKVNVPLEASEKKISITGIAIVLIILIALYQIINMHRKRNQNNENSSGDDNE
ncbi:COG1361 S-layer family protein [Methanosarcina sp. Mfa9]|uniref:COG1361 S-layer family protein n=1 Tax=Methanosarcina sp. Mfa9 TaxID=3439063 RepID=UPI003F85D618